MRVDIRRNGKVKKITEFIERMKKVQKKAEENLKRDKETSRQRQERS